MMKTRTILLIIAFMGCFAGAVLIYTIQSVAVVMVAVKDIIARHIEIVAAVVADLDFFTAVCIHNIN